MSIERTGRHAAAIFGCAGTSLTAEERAFFRAVDPAGFILFKRNCEAPDQVRALVADLRALVGWRAPVLIDQEGGRVQRLRPPHWRAAPPARRFAELYRLDAVAGLRAAWVNARLIADELADLGIDVDCAPVLDNPVPGAHDVIGDRALGDDVRTIAALGRAVIAGLTAGGVLPVIKHLPGHGRAQVDSHLHCPVVEADEAALGAHDLPPFRALADAPFAMTAHVVYRAWDTERVATWSHRIITDVIRGAIGFTGCLLSDDLSMQALDGGLGERAERALAAGCDLALHCNGDLAEMRAVAGAAGTLSDIAADRFTAALDRRTAPDPIDRLALMAELDALLARLANERG
ncbi:beta-hexosaminidase [Aliidongia dinghuensis]|uniref:beta-N-acetylhexosaminidase n=1 Tax=Aliidongia dinghuensis TaxID=1867774 RepID=A0A8J2YTC7_9PROT|nr:beta-N-acetylhexosaminidase [Aliidongia dinghuensis]GGF13677.1 beta-hexosaminidase [Aliidongia dinghuensis]